MDLEKNTLVYLLREVDRLEIKLGRLNGRCNSINNTNGLLWMIAIGMGAYAVYINKRLTKLEKSMEEDRM